MRHLFQPRVLKSASTAALISTAACYPSLSLWLTRPAPLWYLEFTLFVCATVLWGFVFAWHMPYTGQPVLFAKRNAKNYLVASLAALLLALAYRFWLDPSLRKISPDEFPADLAHWFAAVGFALGVGQLFLTFAPFDWLMRLSRNRWISAGLTALFGVGVTAMRLQPHVTEIPALALAGQLAGHFIGALLAVIFYLRGGLALAYWWAVLFELRLLPELI
jgi:hypothetical protein